MRGVERTPERVVENTSSRLGRADDDDDEGCAGGGSEDEDDVESDEGRSSGWEDEEDDLSEDWLILTRENLVTGQVQRSMAGPEDIKATRFVLNNTLSI